jgi:hypothetical protein
LLTEAQIRTLERARKTLTSVQAKLESCTGRSFDDGRVAQACENAEYAIFEVINLTRTLAFIEKEVKRLSA